MSQPKRIPFKAFFASLTENTHCLQKSFTGVISDCDSDPAFPIQVLELLQNFFEAYEQNDALINSKKCDEEYFFIVSNFRKENERIVSLKRKDSYSIDYCRRVMSQLSFNKVQISGLVNRY